MYIYIHIHIYIYIGANPPRMGEAGWGVSRGQRGDAGVRGWGVVRSQPPLGVSIGRLSGVGGLWGCVLCFPCLRWWGRRRAGGGVPLGAVSVLS